MTELTPQARAARVTIRLLEGDELTTREIVDMTGITDTAVRYMMDGIGVVIPLYKPGIGRWKLLTDDDESA